MHVVIVIPAYNEASALHDIAQRALRQCRDVIVVDDGSTDGTADAVAGLPVVLVRHRDNLGKGVALRTGFDRALAMNADAVVTLDGDGQHQPENVARLIEVATAHPHRLIIAARLQGRECVPRLRHLANRFADFSVAWAAGHAVVDSQSGQRLYPAALLRRVLPGMNDSARFEFETDILIRAARLGYTCVAMPIAAIYDPSARASHFRPVHDLLRICRVIARQLLASRFDLKRLWRSVRTRPSIV